MQPAAARLPADTSIGSVQLRVQDADRSLGFYQDLLGLAAQRLDDSSPFESGAASALVRVTAVPGTPRRSEGVLGLYHFAILFPDRGALAGVLRDLIEARWPFSGFADHGVSEAAYLFDPDGIGLELYADRPREIWPRGPGGLTMYTRPLDLDDLLAESGSNVGAGGGPRIGHMHFHVADTARSTSFYRDTVGFDVMLDSLPGAVFLSAGGYHHHVGVNTWARGRTADPAAAGLLAWTLRIPDAAGHDALIGRLGESRAKSHRLGNVMDGAGEGTEAPDSGGYRDPDGNVLIVERAAQV